MTLGKGIDDPILRHIMDEIEIGEDLEWSWSVSTRFSGSSVTDSQCISLKFKTDRDPYIISLTVKSDKDYLTLKNHRNKTEELMPLADPNFLEKVRSYIVFIPHWTRMARGAYDEPNTRTF